MLYALYSPYLALYLPVCITGLSSSNVDSCTVVVGQGQGFAVGRPGLLPNISQTFQIYSSVHLKYLFRGSKYFKIFVPGEPL